MISSSIFKNHEIGSVFIAVPLTKLFLYDVGCKKLGELSECPYGILRGLGIDRTIATNQFKKLIEGNYLLLLKGIVLIKMVLKVSLANWIRLDEQFFSSDPSLKGPFISFRQLRFIYIDIHCMNNSGSVDMNKDIVPFWQYSIKLHNVANHLICNVFAFLGVAERGILNFLQKFDDIFKVIR